MNWPETTETGVSRFMTSTHLPDDDATAPTTPKRTWRSGIRVGLRGIKKGIRGQSSFFVHFFFGALVVAAAVVLRCELVEWCILLGCIGFVLVSELISSALQTLVRGLDKETRDRVSPALDIAAGGVLMATITASIIGTILFINRLWILMPGS